MEQSRGPGGNRRPRALACRSGDPDWLSPASLPSSCHCLLSLPLVVFKSLSAALTCFPWVLSSLVMPCALPFHSACRCLFRSHLPPPRFLFLARSLSFYTYAALSLPLLPALAPAPTPLVSSLAWLGLSRQSPAAAPTHQPPPTLACLTLHC